MEESTYPCRGLLLCVTQHTELMDNGLCANCGGHKTLYKIIDKNNIEMPRHHSGRGRTLAEVNSMLERLNKNGEFRPYKMEKL